MNSKSINESKKYLSLVERMKPNNLCEYIGHSYLIGPDTVLNNLLKTGIIPSMILWGPPGCGKAALVNVFVQQDKKFFKQSTKFIELSAETARIGDIKNIVKEVKTLSKRIIVFMKEIHKFNKLQQDIFLPHIEAGTFTLIGTTIENPYSLNSALLSRCRIFRINKLQNDVLISIISKAIELLQGKVILNSEHVKKNNLEASFYIEQQVIEWLAEVSDGDGKIALNGLEMAVQSKLSSTDNNINIDISDVKRSLQAVQSSNSKKDNIYHMHSALHHCIIADDDNAALYWLARILKTGEDPVYIAKRLVRIASEDIDLDEEDAINIASHTMHACQMIGMPECDVLLAQCVIYLSRCEKSKEILNALTACQSLIVNHEGPQLQIPLFMKNKTNVALDSHGGDESHAGNVNRSYLPEGLEDINFFES